MRLPLLAFVVATSLAAAAPAQEVGLRAYPKLDLAGFSGDPTALATAVSDIETLTGGRVVEIRYDNVDGLPAFDAVVVEGPQVRFLRFFGPNATPIELVETTTPAWMLGWRAQANVRYGEAAKVELADAIQAAEADNDGAPAVAAGIAGDPNNDVQIYNVLLVKNGIRQRVAVDIKTGSITDPSAFTD